MRILNCTSTINIIPMSDGMILIFSLLTSIWGCAAIRTEVSTIPFEDWFPQKHDEVGRMTGRERDWFTNLCRWPYSHTGARSLAEEVAWCINPFLHCSLIVLNLHKMYFLHIQGFSGHVFPLARNIELVLGLQLSLLCTSKFKFEHPQFCMEQLEYVSQKIQDLVMAERLLMKHIDAPGRWLQERHHRLLFCGRYLWEIKPFDWICMVPLLQRGLVL